MNSKFCSRPFHSITTRIRGSEVSYKPCCHINETYAHDLESYLSSEKLRSLRSHFLHSEGLPNECHHCKSLEEKSITSPREFFPLYTKWQVDEKIRRAEIMPNNTCNLSCFMCSEHNSSSWAQEYQQLGWLSGWTGHDASEEMLEICNSLSDLEQVSIIGGEFFLAKKNVGILKSLLEKKVKRIEAYTNATIMNDEQLELLKRFEDPIITISLDGVGRCYEFMRYPADWETVYSNILKLKNGLGIKKLIIASVIQPLNVQYMRDMLIASNKLKIQHRFDNLFKPTWLSWSILTGDEKCQIRDSVPDLGMLSSSQQKQIQVFLDTMDSVDHSPEDRREFSFRMKRLLSHRKITQERISEHFGVLTTLENEVM